MDRCFHLFFTLIFFFSSVVNSQASYPSPFTISTTTRDLPLVVLWRRKCLTSELLLDWHFFFFSLYPVNNAADFLIIGSSIKCGFNLLKLVQKIPKRLQSFFQQENREKRCVGSLLLCEPVKKRGVGGLT